MCGPFEVKMNKTRGSQKRWVALFTCLKYRGIHTEVVADESADSFIMGFFRFAAMRGCPDHVYSDNGSNFRRTREELRLISLAGRSLRAQYPQMQWHLNPPYTPHMGGAWERMVGLLKTSLKTVITPGIHTEDEFHTATVLAREFVNCRPLAYVSGDPNDEAVLTPNSFLRPGNSLPPHEEHKHHATEFVKRWKPTLTT